MEKPILRRLDSLSVLEISTLADLCSVSIKYYRYDRNLKAAWRASIRNGDYSGLCSRIGMEYIRNPPPKEAIDALKKFVRPSAVSDRMIFNMLQKHWDQSAYKPQYVKMTKEREEAEWRRFTFHLMRAINRRSSQTGIKVHQVLQNDNRK